MRSLVFLFKRDTWQEVFSSIGKNRTRTAITVVGVLWGIFLLIVLLGMARGMKSGFARLFGDFATNSVFIWSRRSSISYGGFPPGRRIQLELGDIAVLQERVLDIAFITPRNQLGLWKTAPPNVSYRLQSYSFPVFGDYPLINQVSRKRLIAGRFLNDTDLRDRRKVVVISEKDASQLFREGEDPIGKYLQINNLYFQVVGVYHPNPNMRTDPDEAIYMPFTSFQRAFNQGDKIAWMIMDLKADSEAGVTERRAISVLKQLHHLSPEDTRAIHAFNMSENFDKLTGFLDGIELLTLIVGIATFLAGVIAIGNILLISVRERTREIGVRRALGATPGSVRGLILLESVFLTLLAGLLGIVFGVGILAFLNAYITGRDVPFYNPTVSLWFLFASLLLMVSLGTLIGLIPAQRAVSIRPIDALRDE